MCWSRSESKQESARTEQSGRFHMFREGCVLNHSPKEGLEGSGRGTALLRLEMGKQNDCTAEIVS